MSDFNLDTYLARVGHAPSPTLDEFGLRSLATAQAFSVPFENVDPFIGRPVNIDPASLAYKILDRGRGGYCFELNGIFLLAARKAGFLARPLLARVRYRAQQVNPRSHTVNLVTIQGRPWLVDVGFGGPGPRAPMPFETDREDSQYGDVYRIFEEPLSIFVLQKKRDAAWVDLYAFTLEETPHADLEVANFYTSRHPDVLFTKHLVCALPTETKRITLFDRDFAPDAEAPGVPVVLDGPSALRNALANDLKVRLDIDAAAKAATKLFPGS